MLFFEIYLPAIQLSFRSRHLLNGKHSTFSFSSNHSGSGFNELLSDGFYQCKRWHLVCEVSHAVKMKRNISLSAGCILHEY